MPKNILIIEDNKEVCEAYTTLINDTQNKFKVESYFHSVEAALPELKYFSPDIIILDINLPGKDGISAIQDIKKIVPKAEIIINSIMENSDLVFQALCEGAVGYITKNSDPKEIILALEEINQGGAPMSTHIARMVVSSFQKKQTTILTERESQILALLVKGKSYKSIVNELKISLGTVKFHIKNIYLKLQVTNKEDAIQAALEQKII